MWIWIVFAVAVIAFVLLFRWLFRWKDPSLDSLEKQSEASLWSKRRGSGGPG